MARRLLLIGTSCSWLSVLLVALTGCAGELVPAVNTSHQSAQLQGRPSVHIVVDRDHRMPAAFTDTFKSFIRDALPNLRVFLDEEIRNPQSRLLKRYHFEEAAT